MKQEYKDKIDTWIKSRTNDELNHTIESSHKEYIRRHGKPKKTFIDWLKEIPLLQVNK